MPPSGAECSSAGRRVIPVALLGCTLVHELPVDSGEDSLLALTEPRIRLRRLRDGHCTLRLRGVVGGIPQMPAQGVWSQIQDPLKLGDPRRSRRRLTGEPLRNRGLRDPKCGSQLPLGQATLGTGALERPPEALPLLSRWHVLVPSEVGAVPTRMPDQQITGRSLDRQLCSCNATASDLY
jgi:hypothetical protein